MSRQPAALFPDRRAPLRTFVLLATVFAAVLLAAPLLSALPAHAQESSADWRTVAGGDEILALAVDPAEPGVLWAGTEGGGLVRWETAGGQFRQWLFPNDPGLAGNLVRDLAFDGQRGLWMAIPGGGVSHLAADGTWDRYGATDGLPAGLDLTAVAVTPDGTVWVGSRQAGLARLAPGAQAWESVVPDEAMPELGPRAWQVADLAVAPDGSLWVAHGRSGHADHPAFSVLDAAAGTWSEVRALGPGGGEEETASAPATDQVMAATFDEAGVLWAGSWARGVLRWDGRTWGRFDTEEGVCSRNVWAVSAGHGEVWVACGQDASAAADRGGGVARWDGRAWQSITAGTAGGLPTNDIVAVAVGPDGPFFGTNLADGSGMGIVGWTAAGILPPLVTAGATPLHNDITALAFTPDGTLWAGTRAHGLMRFDGRAWSGVTRAEEPGLTGDAITALAVGRGAAAGSDASGAAGDAVLFVGATKLVVEDRAYVDGGLSVLEVATGTWRLVRAADGALPDNDVGSLAVGPDGKVWVGIGTALGGSGIPSTAQMGDGLAVWDPRTEDWGVLTKASTGGGLPGDTVVGLVAQGAELWAATSYATDRVGDRRGGGLARLTGLDWTAWANGVDGFRTFAEPGTAVTGDVRSLLLDEAGGAWAGTWSIDDAMQLTGKWPRVDAVVNRWTEASWQTEVFREAGWVGALAQDTVGAGRVWAGTSRGSVGEFSPSGAVWLEEGPGGVWLLEDGAWRNLTPESSGLPALGISALAVEPATGHVWVGTVHGGLSVYGVGAPRPIATICADCPAAGGSTDAVGSGGAVGDGARGVAGGLGGASMPWLIAALAFGTVATLALLFLLRRRSDD